MAQYDVIVIGGGAAGIMAAITAKRKGASVLLCEKMLKLGKKILVTGAGRCNLLNEQLNESFYNPGSKELVRNIFGKFGKDAMLAFFKELGLAIYADETGRIFPVTNQAASVLKVLEMELERLKVPFELNCCMKNIETGSQGFLLKTGDGRRFTGNKIILCAGGKSYPALGADGNGYALAAAFRHKIIEPVPSTVPLLVKDPCCHFLQGQKIRAKVTSRIEGKNIRTVSGELLFTQYGLSGTAILDVSDEISIAVNRNSIKDVTVVADLVPFMSEAALAEELSRRFEKGVTHENLLEGLLPHKFFLAFRNTIQKADASSIAHMLKQKEFKITGTRGWNEAEFTAGGVSSKEVNSITLESKLQKGLYFAGEVLDVQGRRGGYNLAWAWASGFVAGQVV